MNICNERQSVLEQTSTGPTTALYSDSAKVYDFNSLFKCKLQEESKSSYNSMAILGDSISVLKQMKDKSVQLIFADAPYNLGKNFGNNSDNRISGFFPAFQYKAGFLLHNPSKSY